jgi:hypothetical protein
MVCFTTARRDTMTHMKRFLVLLAPLLALTFALAQKSGNPFVGRWDITVTTPRGAYPDWMEVDANGATRVQPRAGSVHPVTDVKFSGPHMTLTLNPAENGQPAVTWELTAEGDKFTGAQKRGGAAAGQLAGVRAPKLDRPMPAAWTAPEPIFDGKDLNGWEPDNPSANHWVAKNGELINESKGANIRTTRKFNDFKLHIEYNCPEDGNSGVYLRGRYEIQVEYEPAGANDRYHEMGSIYGFLAPAVQLPKKPGQWETYEVTLVGRRVTIIRDGVKTIDNQEIPGITGGALDSHEAEPGPFYIQGDHTGGMKYRNITIALPK